MPRRRRAENSQAKLPHWVGNFDARSWAGATDSEKLSAWIAAIRAWSSEARLIETNFDAWLWVTQNHRATRIQRLTQKQGEIHN